MVCKEEICNWFRHTQSYERLDLLCKLLHLCSSHEIRFIASIVEDQARKDCSALRDSAFKANEVSELKKLSPDLFKPPDRSNLLVYLSLLSSANTACAHVLFTMLTRVESQRLECHLHNKQNPGKEPPPNIGKMDSETADDVILLYTMAAYHPAFTITQRLQLSDYLQKAQAALAEYLSKPEIQESYSGVHTSTNISTSCSNNLSTAGKKCRSQLNTCPSRNNCQSQNSAIKTAVFVKKIEYKHCHWDMCGQCHVFHIKVTMSTEEVRDIHVTYQQLYDFSDKLLALFRVDPDAEMQLPYLRSEQEGEGLVNEEHISKYIRELSELPDHILHSDYFTEFFGGSEFSSNRSVGYETNDLYRSQLSDDYQDTTAVMFSGQVATSNDECLDLYQCLSVPTAHSTTTVVQQRISYSSVVVSPLPHHSPLPSPLPSPHISPSQHTIMIRKWLKDMRLHKYNSLSEYSWHELSQLDDQDLEKIGLTDGARRKFRKELETQLQRMGEVISKNGVINPLHKRQDATQSCNSMNSQSSAQTVCTPALSPSLNSSVCENHTQVHLPLNIVTRVGCSPSVTNGMNSANSLSSCSGLSDCSAVTPPSSPQSQGSIAPVCTSSHQVGLPPANSQKPYSVDNGDQSEESNTPINPEVALSPAHQGPGIPNIAEVHPFTKNTSPSECHLQIAYPVKPDCTSDAGMPPNSQRIPQMVPIRVPPPGDKGMPVAMPPFGVRPRKPLNAPHVRSPRMQNNGNQFVAPLMPVPPVTAASQAVHSVCVPHNGLTEAPHGLLITKPGGTQPSQISPEIVPCISNMAGDGGTKPAVNFSVLPTPPQGLIPCVPSAMGPAPGCHVVQRPTALAIPNTNCMAYNSITTPSVVTTMLDKPSPILLPPANIPPPPVSTSDVNVPYQNSATCSVTFTTRTAFTPVVPSPGSNQSGSSLLSTPPSSLTPQPSGTNSGGSAVTSASASLIHPTSTQTPTTVPTPVPQTPSLPHSTIAQSECGCSSCQQHASHSPQPAQHPAPLPTIPTTVPFNYHLQQQPQQSMGWPQSPMFPGSYPLPSGYVPVSSNGLVNPSISFPLFTPQVPQSPFANLPPEVLFEPHNYALFQAANQSLPHTFHAQLHYPVLPSYVTGVHLPCQNSKPKSASCYNCGNHGHMPYDCKAPTFEAISRAQFCLKLQPRTEAD